MKTYWKSVSTISLVIWLIAVISFWVHVIVDDDGFLLLDYVNLLFHEFGHLFFNIFGRSIGLWGGTIMQLVIPIGILLGFWLKKETLGVAFGAFWSGENLLNISGYIADARRMNLPLVGSGEHDWNIILSGLNMLQYDTLIAGIVRASGWVVMLSSVIWLLIISIKNPRSRIAGDF